MMHRLRLTYKLHMLKNQVMCYALRGQVSVNDGFALQERHTLGYLPGVRHEILARQSTRGISGASLDNA